MENLCVVEFDDRRWITFISRHDQAAIFHHPAWLQLLSACYQQRSFVIAVTDSTGEIRAGIPVVDVQSFLTGHRWVSLPFTDHCAPLYDDPYWLSCLTGYLLELFQEGQTPQIELRWEYSAEPDLYYSQQYVLTTLQLDARPETVAKRINHKYRRLPRVAQERGAYAVMGRSLEDIDTFYRLHTFTRRRLGVPVQPKKFFDLLWKQVIDPGMGFVTHVYKDGNCLCSAVFLHWNQTLIYKYSARSGLEKKLSPNDLLLWTAIQWGCENNYKVLDLGRSSLGDEGLRRFKRRWGAKESPLIYSFFADSKPALTNGKLHNVMETVIGHSPQWVCRLTGELLYRHFG